MTTSQVSTKVWFVSCPKCLNILAELPEVPLYKCGGCGTILQAKNRRMEMNHTEIASRRVIDADVNTQNDNVAEEEDAISSNHDTSYPARELSPNKNDVTHEDFNEFPGSSEEKVSTIEDTRKQDDINQHISRDQNEGEESERALQEGNNFLVGVHNSPELKDEENEIFPQVKDKPTQNLFADEDGSLNREITRDGVDSSRVEIVSHENYDPTPPQSALKRSNTPFDPPSPDNDHLARHHGSVSSVDTMGSSTPFDRSFDLGDKHGEVTNSRTTRSYYAYDGSESSYDYFQIQQRVSQPSRRNINKVDTTSARELPIPYKFRVNNDHEMNYRRPSSSSILHKRRHHSTRGLQWTHGEGKMELLRTVCTLKDQLDRIQFPKFAPNAKIPTSFVNGNSPAHYYDRLEPEMEIYTNSSNSNPRRADRVAFSGEAAHYRHHVNPSFPNRYPQERYHSAQLPSYPTHISSFANPQQYTSSEISLWGRKTKFDDQRQRDDEIKRLYLKEKYHTEKRHLRPIAGAAPVFTCYHCFRLLELPEDFLLVEKRCHQVRCNACRKVLKLSLVNRAHLVPYPSQSKNKSLMGSVESVGPASQGGKMRKQSSEMEERTSALHWLMGYESPSQVYEN